MKLQRAKPLFSMIGLFLCMGLKSSSAFLSRTPVRKSLGISRSIEQICTRRIRALPDLDGSNDESIAEKDSVTTSSLPPIDDTMETNPSCKPTPEATPQNISMGASDMMRALGTSPRRVAISFLSASGIALAGNFLGITSNLLTAVPEDAVEASGLDTYFPRGDFKRCRARGYTFVIPKEWVADTFVELAKAQRNVQPLDLQMKRTGGGGGTLPDSAFGPPGRLNQKGVSESGDTNVSVIVTSGLRGFSLEKTLGEPKEAAEKLLRLSIAPEGSGRVATLLGAVKDNTRQVYQFEFNVDRGSRGPPVKNISVVAATPQGDKLITMTVVAPLQQWNDKVFDARLRKIASSFHLTT